MHSCIFLGSACLASKYDMFGIIRYDMLGIMYVMHVFVVCKSCCHMYELVHMRYVRNRSPCTLSRICSSVRVHVCICQQACICRQACICQQVHMQRDSRIWAPSDYIRTHMRTVRYMLPVDMQARSKAAHIQARMYAHKAMSHVGWCSTLTTRDSSVVYGWYTLFLVGCKKH